MVTSESETIFDIGIATPTKTVMVKDGKRKQAPLFGNFDSESQYMLVPYNKLKIDYRYQRPLDKNRVSKMAHAWNQDLVGVLIVNRRKNENAFYIIDGQQRYGSMGLMINTPEKVLCQVFTNLTLEEEARLFERLDTQRNGLTKGQLFDALLTANDPAALEIAEIAASCGLTVNIHSSGSKNLRAIGTIMGIHRRSGKEILKRILTVVSNAWPNDKYWSAGSILTGLEALYKKYPQIKDDHLIDILGKTTPHLLETRARGLSEALTSSLSQWVARVIVLLYNKNMKKNRLPDWD